MATQNQVFTGVIVGALIVAVLGGFLMFGTDLNTSENTPEEGENLDSSVQCPSNGETEVSLFANNPLDTSATDRLDVNYKLRSASGNIIEGTNTTGGTQTLNCGQTYTLEVISGQDTSHSEVQNVISPSGATVSNGNVEFVAKRSTMDLRFEVTRHSELEFQAYNLDERANVYETGGSTDWVSADATFQNVDNGSEGANVGSGDSLNYELSVRGETDDAQFSDRGVLMLVDMDVTEFKDPEITFNGQTLQDSMGDLTVHESRAFSDYDFAYRVDSDLTASGSGDTFDVYLESLNNIDPSTNVDITFASVGQYESTDATNVKEGAAKDNSATDPVHTLQTATIGIK